MHHPIHTQGAQEQGRQGWRADGGRGAQKGCRHRRGQAGPSDDGWAGFAHFRENPSGAQAAADGLDRLPVRDLQAEGAETAGARSSGALSLVSRVKAGHWVRCWREGHSQARGLRGSALGRREGPERSCQEPGPGPGDSSQPVRPFRTELRAGGRCRTKPGPARAPPSLEVRLVSGERRREGLARASRGQVAAL